MLNSKEIAIKKGFAAAATITKRYAKTYYFSSRFLPKEKKDAAFSIYAICRISDESVDNAPYSNQVENLIKITRNIESIYAGKELQNNILLSFRETVNKYQIPKQYFDELIQGMYMDLNKKRYENFNELYGYCYRVAGVIGLIMLKIFGYKDPGAEKYAVNLGVAMQLTNILRDIKEDFQRGRIYLPQDEMSQYGISESHIAEGKIDKNFQNLMEFKIRQARQYYAEVEPGIAMIDDLSSQLVIYTIKDLYSSILDAIGKNNYDVFSKRVYVNDAQKIIIALKILNRKLLGRFFATD